MSLAILFIVVIALAGLGFVVVKALGGEEVTLPKAMQITLPPGIAADTSPTATTAERTVYRFPEAATSATARTTPTESRPEAFQVAVPAGQHARHRRQRSCRCRRSSVQTGPGQLLGHVHHRLHHPHRAVRRPVHVPHPQGHVVEASLIGAAGVLAATVAGNWIPGSRWSRMFSLGKRQTVLALCGYGFVASVLPVWLLLCPRDYLSSFLKIGTIALLVVGVFLANPELPSPTVNHDFVNGGPTFQGSIFPFVFICIMCGAISGFHALVSSGTTPKMIDKESQVRPIGYGAMLMEGLVGIVALIAAASLDRWISTTTSTSIWTSRRSGSAS